MKARLSKLADLLKSSYWFLPALLSAGALTLALLLGQLDVRLRLNMPGVLNWFFGEPDSARAILTTIAGAMVSIASMTFSVTMVVLALASQQFGPRLLFSFMRDRGNQTVLGIFIATFLYCLVTLRLVPGEETAAPVPHLSIGVAVLLALLSVGALIYFINHLVHSIQATHMVAAVADDLRAVIRRMFPAPGSAPAIPPGTQQRVLDAIERGGDALRARQEGVIQAMEVEALVKAARASDRLLRFDCRSGDFVFSGQRIGTVYPDADEGLEAAVCESLLLGARRTLIQDVEFGFLQLVELAVRALSPGYNDPFTAIAALDRLTAALTEVARREATPELHCDRDGEPRVIIPGHALPHLVDVAYGQIHRHARDHLVVHLHLLDRLATLAEYLGPGPAREAILRQAQATRRAALDSADDGHEAARLEERWAAVERALGQARGEAAQTR